MVSHSSRTVSAGSRSHGLPEAGPGRDRLTVFGLDDLSYDEIDKRYRYFADKGRNVFTAHQREALAMHAQRVKDSFTAEANSSPANTSYAILDEELAFFKKVWGEVLEEHQHSASKRREAQALDKHMEDEKTEYLQSNEARRHRRDLRIEWQNEELRK